MVISQGDTPSVGDTVRHWFTVCVCLALGAALSGCASTIVRMPVPTAMAGEVAYLPKIQGARFWGDEVPTDIREEYRRKLPNLKQLGAEAKTVNGRLQIEILALSGGGPDGAFGAGILTGWTARGDRPEFELVTGVSAGAIIAPFAYLGSEYDPQLKEIWTEYETRQIATPQVLPGLLGGDALADTGPLKGLIAKYIDAEFLRRIAAEYRRGRVLTIGTTNLDAKRPVVWNMGEIAIHASPEAVQLFRDVILASASIPGLFPPVNIKVSVDGKIYDEMHVDGGVTRQIYVAPVNLPFTAFDALYPVRPDRRLYLIQNGKLTPDYAPVEQQTIPIAASSISTLLLNQNKGDIYRIYRMALDANVNFNLLAVPRDFRQRPENTLDPAYQQALFAEGYTLGSNGGPWLTRPPDVPVVGSKTFAKAQN
jgi:predicted acylesterase/phospholipase RssA